MLSGVTGVVMGRCNNIESNIIKSYRTHGLLHYANIHNLFGSGHHFDL